MKPPRGAIKRLVRFGAIIALVLDPPSSPAYTAQGNAGERRPWAAILRINDPEDLADRVLAAAMPAGGQDDASAELAGILKRLRETAGRSVVAIEVSRAKDPEGEAGSGPAGVHRDYYSRPPGPTSGTILTADGLIATSAFNVSGEVVRIAVTTWDGREFDAKLLGTSTTLDIAILKIEASDLPVLRRPAAETGRVGDFAAVLGRSPSKLHPTVNVGILSAVSRMGGTALQTDAEINYGNAGGPLLTLSGELLGVVCHVRPRAPWGQSSGVGFATRVSIIERSLEDLTRRRPREAGPTAWIGIVPGDAPEGAKGVRIQEVIPGSPAERAGLLPGDLVVGVGGRAVVSAGELRAVLEARKPGDEVRLAVRRLNSGRWEEKEIVVRLAEAPGSSR